MTSHRAYYEQALGLRPNGREQQTVRCPFHEDKRESFSVNLTTGAWTCHAGCGAGGRAAFAQRLNGSVPAKPEATAAPRVKVSARRETEATYHYCGENGNVLFRKLRCPGKKFFLGSKLDGDQWAKDLVGVEARPLYNLPAVIAAKNVAFTEGEKDADRLNALFKKLRMNDWAATTNFDGASGPWREEYKAPLTRKNVVVVPDNDEPGRLHGEAIARGAKRVAASVGVLTLPDLAEKGDVSDYLDAHPATAFRALLKKVKPWVDPVPSLFLTAAELNAETPETTPWIVQGLLAESSSTELFGKPKMGKSTFTHCMVRAVLEGGIFLDRRAQKSPVVYLTEMTKHEVMAELKTVGLQASDDLHILLYQRAMKLSWSATIDLAIAEAQTAGAKLLIVDTFAKWTQTKEENSSGETLANFVSIDRAMEAGLAVWIESHERKAGGGIADAGRGSNALSGAVGTIVQLQKPKTPNQPASYRALDVNGRFDSWSGTLNWDLDKAEYVFLGEKAAVATTVMRAHLSGLMPKLEKDALPFSALLALLKKKHKKASRTTLQRALDEWMKNDIVRRVGTSLKTNLFRYYIRAEAMPTKEKF